MDYHFLETSLLLTAGPCGLSPEALGHVHMQLWLKALKVPGEVEVARGCLVRSSVDRAGAYQARSLEVPIDRVNLLAARLGDLGFPGRAPRVEQVVDSSDGWAHVLLHVRRDKQQATLSLDLASSGFDGEDAQALRAVFRCLLEAAGLDEREPFWSDLTG